MLLSMSYGRRTSGPTCEFGLPRDGSNRRPIRAMDRADFSLAIEATIARKSRRSLLVLVLDPGSLRQLLKL